MTASAQVVVEDQLERKLVRGTLWSALHATSGIPLAIISNAIVARILGPADYGVVAFLSLSLGIATQVTHMNVSGGVVQWGAGAEERGDRDLVHELLARSLGYHVFVQFPLLVGVTFYLARNLGPVIPAVIVIGFLLSVLFSSPTLLLTIMNRTDSLAKVAMGSNVVIQAGVALVAIMVPTPQAVWAYRQLGTTIAVPINYVLIPRDRRRGLWLPRSPFSMPAGFWKFCTATWIAGLLASLALSRTEVFFLTHFSTLTATGVYALAFGLAMQLTAPLDALMGPLAPAAAAMAERGEAAARASFASVLRIATTMCGLWCSVAPVGVAALIPALYGRDFDAAAFPFMILGIASCIQTALNPLVSFRLAQRRSGLVLRASVSALGANMTASFLLIPVWGLVGAVVSSVIGLVGYFSVIIWAELRSPLVGIRELRRAAFPLSLGFLSAGIALTFISAVPLPTPAQVALGPVAGLVSYVGLIRGQRAGLTAEQCARVTRVLPRRLRPVTRLLAFLMVTAT